VALVDNASILSVATILAAARIGAASAQMNVLLTTDELSKLATAVDARVGVAGEPFRTNLPGALGAGAVLGEDDVAGSEEEHEEDGPDGAVDAVADTQEQISYGAAAAPVALVERALDALPEVRFSNVFGQTETLGAYAALTPDDHWARRKLGSAGKPLSGVELRIVDVASESDCPAGAVGRVWVRAGQNVTRDWLRTGDLAFLDDDGYLHPVGRMTDTINRGGQKFGPIEVEEVLRSHPAVRDAGVCGVPDAELGQRVAAVVVTVDGEDVGADDLRAFAAERLARYKLPERIVFAGDLPYSNLGKVSRQALAAVVLAEEASR
jgi:acyl-CoA synthetase (AMP-forming)/AMP-acid ligase II